MPCYMFVCHFLYNRLGQSGGAAGLAGHQRTWAAQGGNALGPRRGGRGVRGWRWTFFFPNSNRESRVGIHLKTRIQLSCWPDTQHRIKFVMRLQRGGWEGGRRGTGQVVVNHCPGETRVCDRVLGGASVTPPSPLVGGLPQPPLNSPSTLKFCCNADFYVELRGREQWLGDWSDV